MVHTNTKESNKKKVVLFGNGIPLNFNPEEYSYPAIYKKFADGLGVAIEMDQMVRGFEPKIKEELESIINWIKELEEKQFNEGLFYDIYERLVLFEMNTYPKNLPCHFLKQGFKSAIEQNKCIIKELDKGNVYNNYNEFTNQYYSNAYNKMQYGLMRAIRINKNNDSYISIQYSKNFISWLDSFDVISTTNYYTNLESKLTNKDLKYLHGQVVPKVNYDFNLKRNGKRIGIGNEFDKRQKQILFGRNYNDKVLLYSLLKWPNTGLQKLKLNKNDELYRDADVEIIGLSVEADKELIKDIIKVSNSLRVYCYSEQDKKEWSELIDKANIFDTKEKFKSIEKFYKNNKKLNKQNKPS